MTDRFFDSHGKAHDPELIHPPTSGPDAFVGPGEALDPVEWQARNDRALAAMERFWALADATGYWMDMTEDKRLALWAQVERETTETELSEAA